MLKQTSEYASMLLTQHNLSAGSELSSSHAVNGGGNDTVLQTSTVDQRKRKRCSPMTRRKDLCMSAEHLALPRTPTQARVSLVSLIHLKDLGRRPKSVLAGSITHPERRA